MLLVNVLLIGSQSCTAKPIESVAENNDASKHLKKCNDIPVDDSTGLSEASMVLKFQGSLLPYPQGVHVVAYPDSLIPRYISHVSRHGSRYPASSSFTVTVKEALNKAVKQNTITPLGKELLRLSDSIISISDGRWGDLDSLGMVEQASIARRMFEGFRPVFRDGTVVAAISSYSPRSIASMNSFVDQLGEIDRSLNITTSSGKQYSYLLRPFDTDKNYLQFKKEGKWKKVYDTYFETYCPLSALTRVLGEDFIFTDAKEARNLAINEYYMVAGLQAMQLPPELNKFFTIEEMEALWSCFNLRQYLQYTSTDVSTVPADMASPLLKDIIVKADLAIAGKNPAVADLRFGHAETMMPILSLLRLSGCYYHTRSYTSVKDHWKDFAIIPMASNLQFIFFQDTKGEWFVRTDLNEKPVCLIPEDPRFYLPWESAKAYLLSCLAAD